jgi:uncharacterized protein YdaU (DUF1376 family)
MHYYQFNIGDYQSHTSHLSDTEDLAYRRMLDWCYLHEKPLPLDVEDIARQIRMRSHCDSITLVLQEYFDRTESGWISERVIKEIEAVGVKKEKASASAKARWNKASHANALPTQSEGNAPNTHNTLPNTQITVSKDTVRPPTGEPDEKPNLKIPSCDHRSVLALYHTTLPNLPTIEIWNETRAGYLRQRWREVAMDLGKKGSVSQTEMLDWWKSFFEHIGSSKFLTGKTMSKDKPPFLADLEWVIKPTNFAKIIEGKYHRD